MSRFLIVSILLDLSFGFWGSPFFVPLRFSFHYHFFKK
jgi:hypothetical protein